MAAVGLGAIWLGGWWFSGLVTLVVGVLIWELARMLDAPPARGLFLVGIAMLSVVVGKLLAMSLWLSLSWLLILPILGLILLRQHRWLFAAMSLFALLAAVGLLFHRDTFGLTWMLWLILVVVVTDVMGYFAGRLLGGPKFWPRVSPKKTWSGTVAGWIGAAAIGGAFMASTGSGAELIAISVALSMASQMGDIAESAIKRHVGVKDSSNLLPGHGGLFDRFDGVLGAALVLLIVESVTAFPPPPV